ncbi:MAG: translation initiation factor IF-2, partial [Gemmatimonadota bacterium]|nr:translation initiation factor IF-2 [Gemmatimonadota bacterium]
PDGRRITFLDTPGHQAFTAMRARGAQVTDIVVLVVSAEDAVMPQTVEAISHARNAGVPMIVAINKIDLPSANVQKVKQDLLGQNVVLEEFGGQVLSTAISAKKGTNIDQLLEQVLLQAEMLSLKANPHRPATGTVVEATLDPGKGTVATILVQKGTLRVGENFICGKYSGRVKALYDERGKNVKEAGPSIPVQILGFEGVPSPGDHFLVTVDAVEARDIAQKRQRLEREAQNRRTVRGGSLEDISRALAHGLVGALRLIIKADQGGPAEALADALGQLSTGEVRVDIVHRGVGSISESDVLLAKASGAIVIGFHVRPDAGARAAAEREQVDVRTYRVIYEAVDDVRNAMEGMLKPQSKEVVLGEAAVLQVFKVSKVGTIAGCQVRHGIIQRTARARVMRDGVQVYEGSLSSLKRFKDDAREVREGLECGIGIENFNDVKVGDVIECFRVDEVKRTLADSVA